MRWSWIPAALMGALVIGYLAGTCGGGPRDDVLPTADYEAPAVSAPAPVPPPLPYRAPPPSSPIPDPPPDDGLGEYPAWNGVDLDCDDVGRPVRVTGPDPHRLDHDGNGVGCEGQ